MTNLLQDVRHAVRMLAKAPGMLVLSVLALTLGIGMPTIMFTIVSGVFADLPVENPKQIVRIVRTDRGREDWDIPHHDFSDLVAEQTTFQGLAGFSTEDVTLAGGDASPFRRDAAFVTANAFEVLGVRPLIGRTFLAGDDTPGAVPVVAVSHGLWQSRFGGDSSAVGRTLMVDGEARIVIGVMPSRFGFPANKDVWLPLQLALEGPRGDSPALGAFGRLRADAAVAQADQDLRVIASRLAREFPETNENIGAGVRPYGDGLIDPNFARGLFTMLGAVSFVLLITCVNVANLLLARAIARTREIAVRSALGASRIRVVSQFLIESLVVATVGGVLGTLVAWRGVQFFNDTLVSFVGISWVDFRIDGTVLMFVVGIVALGATLAGILPAVQASGVDVSSALKDAPRGTGGPGLKIGRL